MGALNIAERLRVLGEKWPWAKAVVVPQAHDAQGRRAYSHVTFRELDALIDRYAHGLAALGVTPGMRTLLLVKPSIEFFGLTFALFRLGAVPVLLDPAMGRTSVLGAIAEVEPEAFVAIPAGHVARILFGKAFRAVRVQVTVGRRLGWGGATLSEVAALGEGRGAYSTAPTKASDLAAILFTSGSTGAPKGVLYTHGIFDAQTQIFADDFKIVPQEVDLSAFPLFSLFSVALGVTVVVPDMDSTKPAQVDGAKIVEHVLDQGVTYAFGSPAFWHRVATFCEANNLTLPSLQRVLMAGAPAPPTLLERLTRLVPASAQIYTPYGATECLPMTLPSARELLAGPVRETRNGKGTCVGKPLGHTRVRIIAIDDGPIEALKDAQTLPIGQIGEICVDSPVTTQGYFRRPEDDAKSKMKDGDRFWHRMGDVGWMDDAGRVWFCGRKSQRVETSAGTMFTECVEPLFLEHPRVHRAALVGLGPKGQQRPVVIIETKSEAPLRGKSDQAILSQEILTIAAAHPNTATIQEVLFHPSFPVDARHNAKIRREALAVWAAKELG